MLCSHVAPGPLAKAVGAAMPFLIEAHFSFDDGHYESVGCQLRECIRRYVAVLIEYHEISRPLKRPNHKDSTRRPRYKKWTVADQILALVCKGYFRLDDAKILLEVLYRCHRLAHCEKYTTAQVAWCLTSVCEEFGLPQLNPALVKEAEGGAV